jgi:hypothetical protein
MSYREAPQRSFSMIGWKRAPMKVPALCQLTLPFQNCRWRTPTLSLIDRLS